MNVTSSFVVLLYIILILKAISGLHTRSKHMIVHRLDVCYLSEDIPLKVHYFNLDRLPDDNYKLSTCGEVLYDQESKDLSAYVDVIRCENKESLDSCEYYTKLVPPVHICHMLKLKELGIYNALNKFTPPCFCPFKKGNYSVKDLTYDLNDFTLFPIGNYYWRAKAHGFLKKKKVGTICLDIQIINRTT